MSDQPKSQEPTETSPNDQPSSDPVEHRRRMSELEAEQAAKVKANNERRGILIVNTGPGKGKSTAAFGTAIRAAGHGQHVAVIQFIKGTWKTGEQAALARFPEIDHVVSGDGFTWKTKNRDQDIASAEKGWRRAVEMIQAVRDGVPVYDLIILDELNIALRYDYLDIAEVCDVLAAKPKDMSIMVTGRDAKAELIELADTVTEMGCVKHAFEAGVKARKGVDF